MSNGRDREARRELKQGRRLPPTCGVGQKGGPPRTPVPSAPLAVRPHASTRPPAHSATACATPAATARTGSPASQADSDGASTAGRAWPRPSCGTRRFAAVREALAHTGKGTGTGTGTHAGLAPVRQAQAKARARALRP